MRFVVKKKALVGAVKSIMPAVAKRTTLPVLSGMRIDATKSTVSLEATDLEMSARRTVEAATVARPGSVVVPARPFAKAISTLNSEELTLESETTDARARLTIRAGSRSLMIDGLPEEDWPRIEGNATGEPVARIAATDLADAFARLSICASDDEARPVLTGVALILEEGASTVEMVATDSYRMGVLRLEPAERAAAAVTVVVAARAAVAIAKELKKRREAVTIRVIDHDSGSRLVVFDSGSAVWRVRSIEGEFPNWRQILPEETGARAEFDAAETSAALTAAASIRSTGVPVRLSLGDRCMLTLAQQDVGALTEELERAAFSPDGVGALEVAFNPDYLADAFRFCGTERVAMWVRDGLKPALLGTPDRRYLLMPVRIS